MQSNNKKKICIVVPSLGKGGAEKQSALLSKMLHKVGYEVHIISVLNNIDYDYSGVLLNLGAVKDKNNTFFGRFRRLLIFKKYLKDQQFDLIIDNRSRPTVLKELLISTLLYKKQKVIYVVHNFKTERYFSKSRFWAKKIYNNTNKAYVGVSKAIAKKIKEAYSLNKVYAIYNAVNFKENLRLSALACDVPDQYILYYGRLDDAHKNISLLIQAYNQSKLPEANIKLLILGSGKDLKTLQEQANNMIVFKPFTPNPFPYIKHAKFCCLTSRYEGFPMVIIEALSVGTPMLSVDCNSGPKEVIVNRQNGLLVKNNNVVALADAMNNFIFDDALYETCKRNAQKSVANFSVEIIAQQWKKIIEEIRWNE
ncbi:MAG: glycosyltransferase family 4 protein [Algicola sp.]|nr:glycosyltransferase family 4 protein [Algicola sp.]